MILVVLWVIFLLFLENNMYQIEDLIAILSRLPGLGKKTASKLAYFFVNNKEYSGDFIKVLSYIKDNIKFCSDCGCFIINSDKCSICSSDSRNSKILCIVEEQKDMMAIEETGVFSGFYHILGGTINPLENRTPEKLRIKELLFRLNQKDFEEILVATNPTIEGDATFLYLQNLIKTTFQYIKISRIATGLPMGGVLEYADKHTLSKAIEQKQYT